MSFVWIAPEMMQRFAGSLLHFIWQGAVIAIVAGIGLRLLRHRSAEARYAFAIASLICMLAAPMFTLAFYAQTGAIAQRLIHMVSQAASASGPSSTVQSGALALKTAAWTQRILVTWCIGVILFAVRLVVGWRLSWQLVKSAEQIVAPGVLELFNSVRHRLGLRRNIQLLAHSVLDSPVVVGWLRPVVLMPVSLIPGFSEHRLIAMFAHELAHIRRHDFMVNILQRCVESILFYHPAVWWLSKRVRAEREHCCDDIAVRLCGSRKIYAEALIEMERARQIRPILAVAAADGIVLQRFRRVLGLKTSAADWQSAIGTLVFVGIWIVVGMWQSSSTLQAKPVLPSAAPVAVAVLPVIVAPAPVAEGINAIAAILTAQPAATPQAASAIPSSKGVIQGTVARAGSSGPIPGATVAIMNAPFDPDALKTLLGFWAARGLTMAPPAPGESEEKFFQTLMDNLAAKGISTSLPANQMAIEEFRDANTARYSTVADANGRFTIKDVPPGKYTVAGGREGFFGGPGGPGGEVIADVEAGKSADVVVSLSPGATITGRVKNAAGRALPNVNVSAYAITYLNGKIIPEMVSSQTSDDRGEYRLFWLPPSDYVVVADPLRFPVSPSPPPGVPIARGGPGAPAPVLSTPQFMRTFYPQSLTTGDAQTIAIKGGEQLSGVDITVQKGVTYKISGEIHAIPGSAVVPARGRGANANPNPPRTITGYLGLEFRDSSVIDMRSTNLGGTVPSVGSFTLAPVEDGFHASFEVRDILPGEYYLVPRLLQSIPAGSGNFTINRIPIDVRDRDITNLAMELFTGVNINGTVTVDGRAPGNAAVRVALRAEGNPSPTYQGIAARAVVAKADDGTFTIANVPPTRYRVELGAGLPPDIYVSDVRQGAISVFETGLEIGKEAPAAIQVVLRSGAGIVEGVVRDGAGKPVPNATVVVIPPDPRRENRALYKTATSDGTGRFTVRGIAPGSYKIFSWRSAAGGEFYNSRFLSKYEFRGKSVNITQGGTVTESLTVIDGI